MEYPNCIGPQNCFQGLLQIIFTLRCDDVPQAVNYQPKDNHIGISTSAFPVPRASYYLLTGSVGLERWSLQGPRTKQTQKLNLIARKLAQSPTAIKGLNFDYGLIRGTEFSFRQ